MTKVILHSFSYIALPSLLGYLCPKEAFLQFGLIDSTLRGYFYCFCLNLGVWWTGDNKGHGVCVAVSE